MVIFKKFIAVKENMGVCFYATSFENVRKILGSQSKHFEVNIVVENNYIFNEREYKTLQLLKGLIDES